VGNLTFGMITPLLSHAAAGAGRVRTLLMSQPEGGKGTCEPARSDTLDPVGLQTRVPGASRQVRGLPSS
jgi:hypothetical protein